MLRVVFGYSLRGILRLLSILYLRCWVYRGLGVGGGYVADFQFSL